MANVIEGMQGLTANPGLVERERNDKLLAEALARAQQEREFQARYQLEQQQMADAAQARMMQMQMAQQERADRMAQEQNAMAWDREKFDQAQKADMANRQMQSSLAQQERQNKIDLYNAGLQSERQTLADRLQSAKEIAGMTTDELESEDKRLQTLIAESPHFKGKGRMPTPEEVDRAQDIVSEIFSRRRGKDEIENERWFERKESASAYLERYGYAKQGDGRFAAGKEKPYAEIEDIESFQGGHKVKLTEFSADIEDKLHAAAEASNATYDRAKRLYQEAIARDGINEANRLLNVSVPNARRKKAAIVSQTGENKTQAELPRTDETQAVDQGGGQGEYDYDLSAVWRGRAPQVAAPTVLKSTTGGKEYAIPGLEELRVTVKPPSGNKAKHTKLGWSVYVGDNLIWANLPGVADTAENAINSARGKLKRIHAAIAKDQAHTTPKTTSTAHQPSVEGVTAPSPGEAGTGFDPLALLTGKGGKPSAEEPARNPHLKRVQELLADTEREINDWATRRYKDNKKTVTVGGDVDSLNASDMEIGRINESRRKRTIEALVRRRKDLEAARDSLESDPESVEDIAADLKAEYGIDLAAQPSASKATPEKPLLDEFTEGHLKKWVEDRIIPEGQDRYLAGM